MHHAEQCQMFTLFIITNISVNQLPWFIHQLNLICGAIRKTHRIIPWIKIMFDVFGKMIFRKVFRKGMFVTDSGDISNLYFCLVESNWIIGTEKIKNKTAIRI